MKDPTPTPESYEQSSPLKHVESSVSNCTPTPEAVTPSALSQEIEEIRKEYEGWKSSGYVPPYVIQCTSRLISIVEELKKANHELKVSYVVQDPWNYVDEIEKFKMELLVAKVSLAEQGEDYKEECARADQLEDLYKNVAKENEELNQTIESCENEVSRVYCHITCGKISKINTCAEDVISVSDDYTMELIEAEVRSLKESLATVERDRDRWKDISDQWHPYSENGQLWCAACGKWGDHQSGTCPEIKHSAPALGTPQVKEEK